MYQSAEELSSALFFLLKLSLTFPPGGCLFLFCVVCYKKKDGG